MNLGAAVAHGAIARAWRNLRQTTTACAPMQAPNLSPAPPIPAASAPQVKRSALVPALAALLLPSGAFAIAWIYAGRIPMAVPKAEWGTWFLIGALMGVAGIAGLVFTFKAVARGGYRSLAAAGLVLNIVVMLTAWVELFA
jgi:hypothetical protein